MNDGFCKVLKGAKQLHPENFDSEMLLLQSSKKKELQSCENQLPEHKQPVPAESQPPKLPPAKQPQKAPVRAL